MTDLDNLQAQINAHLERIERMAEERHLLHGRLEDAFWSCSRVCCQSAANYLRSQPKHYACKAREAGTAGGNEGQDCDWPFCGCDPAATRVLSAIQEQGLTIVKEQAK